MPEVVQKKDGSAKNRENVTALLRTLILPQRTVPPADFRTGSLHETQVGTTAQRKKDKLAAMGCLMLANIRQWEGEEHNDPKKIEDAIKLCTKAIEFFPEGETHNLADAHFLRSLLYAELGKHVESQQDLVQVRALNADFAIEFVFRANDVHHTQTLADVKLEELRTALKAADIGISEEPNEPATYFLRSRLHELLYKRTKDENHFLKAAQDKTRGLFLQMQVQ